MHSSLFLGLVILTSSAIARAQSTAIVEQPLLPLGNADYERMQRRLQLPSGCQCKLLQSLHRFSDIGNSAFATVLDMGPSKQINASLLRHQLGPTNPTHESSGDLPTSTDTAAFSSTPLRIAVLVVWAGPIPSKEIDLPWISFWAASAKKNARFADFFVFTDAGKAGVFDEVKGGNIKLITIEDIARRYSDSMKFKVPVTPNNLKGMKAALGFVWYSFIEGYSHWCWSDVDIIYGDLGQILSRPLSRAHSYDAVTVVPHRGHWCVGAAIFAGQFTVWRNTPETRTLFTKVRTWKSDFSSARFSRMDEIDIAHAAMKHVKVLFLEAQLTTQRLSGPGQMMENSTAAWVDGRLFHAGGSLDAPVLLSEGALLHLSELKLRAQHPPTWNAWGEAADHSAFSLEDSGFLMPLTGEKPSWRPLTKQETAAIRDAIKLPPEKGQHHQYHQDAGRMCDAGSAGGFSNQLAQ